MLVVHNIITLYYFWGDGRLVLVLEGARPNKLGTTVVNERLNNILYAVAQTDTCLQ